jgi:hypothetical protein
MTTREQNDFLTRTGPGTGWALFSALRIRLLSQEVPGRIVRGGEASLRRLLFRTRRGAWE